MNKFYKNALAAGFTVSALLVSGCAMLPYEQEFACKNEDHGQCIHPEDAYREAVDQSLPDAAGYQSAGDPINRKKRRRQEALSPVATAPGGYDSYRNAVYDQLAAIVEAPVTPMVAPAKTVRTLILPYTDRKGEGRLYMARYVYSVLEQPRFVLGDYLSGQSNDFAGALANGLMIAPAHDSTPTDASAESGLSGLDGGAATVGAYDLTGGSD